MLKMKINQAIYHIFLIIQTKTFLQQNFFCQIQILLRQSNDSPSVKNLSLHRIIERIIKDVRQMSNSTLQFHIILLISDPFKIFFNTHWLKYQLKIFNGLIELHAKRNALHRIYLVTREQCKLIKLTNRKKLFKQNMIRKFPMKLGNFLNVPQINTPWQQNRLFNTNVTMMVTSRDKKLDLLQMSLNSVKALTNLKSLPLW